MQADGRGLRLIEKIRSNGFPDVGAQRIPRVALRENVVRKTFAHEPAVGFLSNAEDNFHVPTFAERRTGDKLGLPGDIVRF